MTPILAPSPDYSRTICCLRQLETTDAQRHTAMRTLDLLAHPETGRDVLMMAVKLVHHKGKDRKTTAISVLCINS
jgi:hypothetical protein